MSQIIPFLKPRLVGRRFDGHAIPLEVLKDLACLDEIIKETAKWRFLKANPERKRIPRGFTQEVSLRITDIQPGSAIPHIVMVVASGLLLPVNQSYYEQARDQVIAAIDAAQHGESITDQLPESILPHFDSLGRSLGDEEAIEFRPENASRPARLDKVVRRKLVLASSQAREVTEEVIWRGAIPEVDQERRSFELQVIGGSKIRGPIEPYHLASILEAFNGYQQNLRVAVRGIAKFNRHNRPQSLQTIEDITVLDANDVPARIDDLRNLKDGWLDGEGIAPTEENLSWFSTTFETHYPSDLQLPFVYPTAEGGLQLEWSISPLEISLEVNLGSKKAEWHSLDSLNGQDEEETLDLSQFEEWLKMAEKIRAAGGTTV